MDDGDDDDDDTDDFIFSYVGATWASMDIRETILPSMDIHRFQTPGFVHLPDPPRPSGGTRTASSGTKSTTLEAHGAYFGGSKIDSSGSNILDTSNARK